MGLFGYAIPQRWGGLGLDITQDVELALELHPLAVRSMFGTNNGIAEQVLVGLRHRGRRPMAGTDGFRRGRGIVRPDRTGSWLQSVGAAHGLCATGTAG